MTPRRLRLIPGLLLAGLLSCPADAPADKGGLVCESATHARFHYSGPVGERVRANIEQWLLEAPEANPAMLEMFRQRDRKPAANLVPWAGEFAGKYLISAVQALRMSEDPRLRDETASVVRAFIATQADDGYLGPFPKEDRLLKNWDLWGHYHAILALTLWHEQTGDTTALTAARRAGDLVCRTFLDTGRRVADAGSAEMNMAILTGMARLYRLTGEARYLRMAREVEKDWETAGDYLRAGLDGREYFEGPRPRWESLHDLQGLVEMWRITGDRKYRDAFEHHWRSIRRRDRRNTGGFSSGEQATGDPYAPTAIETCCTTAWMAITIDHLRLTGDLRAADDLELATLNGGLGAQHPSGRWWTYSTPMDGVREASGHAIVFQARAGSPELNCCSVNGPRIPGMLSEWGVMTQGDGLTLNWLGASTFDGPLPGGGSVAFAVEGDAWRDLSAVVKFTKTAAREWTLRVRMPSWASRAEAALNGKPEDAAPGRYLELRRRWRVGDRITLRFDAPVRYAAGANAANGKASLYRGPLLLAYDPAFNGADAADLPAVDLSKLPRTTFDAPARSEGAGAFSPWLTARVPAAGGGEIVLVDFANAGARGGAVRSWLAAAPTPAAPAFERRPRDGESIPPGETRFLWQPTRRGAMSSFVVEWATDEAFKNVVASVTTTNAEATLDTRRFARNGGVAVYWRVGSKGAAGIERGDGPPAVFRVVEGAPPQSLPPVLKTGPRGELIEHSLRNGEPPRHGRLEDGPPPNSDATGTGLNGRNELIRYLLPGWPDDDFTVAVRVRLHEAPKGRIGQIFSAWHGPSDDPLRLVIDGGKLHLRVEGGGGASTSGVSLAADEWHAVAAVRAAGQLTLWVDGRAAASCAAPSTTSTGASDCALGGNPHFGGNEFLAARFADFLFLNRALGADELKAYTSKRAP
jgi:uncharacterized protein